ncbi:9550_t:CDS:2, partial [Scutellospora calospora]
RLYGPVESGFFRKVMRQEHYPLLEVREENPFADLPENLYTLIENLNSYTCESINSNQVNDQAYGQQDITVTVSSNEQESIMVSSNEYPMDIDIANDNQDLILFENRKKEILNLLDETKKILEKNVANPNKWLDSIEKNFEPLRKLVEDCKQFERQNHIPNTWKN